MTVENIYDQLQKNVAGPGGNQPAAWFLKKTSTLKGKNLLHLGTNSFLLGESPYRTDPF